MQDLKQTLVQSCKHMFNGLIILYSEVCGKI